MCHLQVGGRAIPHGSLWCFSGLKSRVSYLDIGVRFGRSHTLQRPIPFDRFLADAMSAHDTLYKLALERRVNKGAAAEL